MVAPVIIAAARGGALIARGAVRGVSRVAPKRLPTVRRSAEGGELMRNEERRADRIVRSPRAAALRRNTRTSVSTQEQGKKKEHLLGFSFYFVTGLALMKDIAIDPMLDLLIAGGLGLSATVAGAIVGLPLAGIAWVAKFAFLLMFFAAASLFFMFNGGVHSSIRVAQMLLWVVGGIAEVLPVIGSLPITTVVFVAVAALENKARGYGIGSNIARMVVEKSESFVPGKGRLLKPI